MKISELIGNGKIIAELQKQDFIENAGYMRFYPYGGSSSSTDEFNINSASYGEAAAKLNVHIKTVIRWAAELDCRKQGNSGGINQTFELDLVLVLNTIS